MGAAPAPEVTPVTPVAPLAPVTPVAPAAPVAPVTPVAPNEDAPPESTTPTIALRPHEGELLVECEPKCGLVLVDGKQLLAYPKPAAVRAGVHGIGAGKPGYGGQWKQVKIEPGTRSVLRFTLTPSATKPAGPRPKPKR
jgi:hypothetical protein